MTKQPFKWKRGNIMKEQLKKASLTVASACLIAGGLVSVGWAASNQSEQTASHQHATTSENKASVDGGLLSVITVNGVEYHKVRAREGPWLDWELPYHFTGEWPNGRR